MRALVWLKRDLRLADHAPLREAARADAAAALYVIEPAWLTSAEFDPQHLAFALACLEPLRTQLAARGLPLWVRQGGVTELLSALHARYHFTHLFSHEETGPGWSYARDRAVRAWCRAHGVVWTEWPQTGVVRGLRDRRGWADRWQARMEAEMVPTPTRWRGVEPPTLEPLPTLAELGLPPSQTSPRSSFATSRAPTTGCAKRRSTPNASRRGARGAPAFRWSTPACGNSAPPAGSTFACGRCW